MIRVALRGLAARKLRAALTGFAIVLGVAMVTAAYVVSDTMIGSADKLADASYGGTDAVISAKHAFRNEDQIGDALRVPASLVSRVRALPDVAAATGDITQTAKLIGRDGKTIGTGPYFAVGLDPRQSGAGKLEPFRLQSGSWPHGEGELAIDAGTASSEHYRVGDRIRLEAQGPARTYRISGIVRFGEVKKLGTATVAVLPMGVAQRLFGKVDAYDGVLVAARDGVSAASLRSTLRRELGPGVQVESARAQDRYTLDSLKSFVSFLQKFLVGIGALAIFVGAFIIFNTLSITVAQRSREFAMLRAVGAARRQVLGSVVVETAVMALVAWAIGTAVGFGLAKGLISLFASLGLDLPRTGTVFATRTPIVAAVMGVGVTLAAGLVPALRATRVSPVAAMREGAQLPPGRIGRWGGRIATAVTVAGAALLGYGVFGSGLEVGARFAMLGLGTLVLFLGVAFLAPRFVRPMASLLGRPSRRIGGAAGALARGNAMRNPQRTAMTAAALMIGIALVAFVATLGSGLRASGKGALDRQIAAEYVVYSHDTWTPPTSQATRALASTPGVAAVSGVRQDQIRAFGKPAIVDGVDPAGIGKVFHFRWKTGSSDAALGRLDGDGAIVREDFARKHHLAVGDRFAVTGRSGRRVELVVRGIEKPPALNPLNLGEVTVSRAAFDRSFHASGDLFTFVKAAPGAAGPALLKALESRLARYPDAKVGTKAKFEKDELAFVDRLLAMLYVLLGLSVVVSLFGIVNTLALSVFERTRELGMLRAVGMTRRQVRRMVRHESVITALIGAAMGVVVGVGLAALATRGLSSAGMEFHLPGATLVAIALVAVIAGVLAAIGPARRASRLNVLRALQYE